MSQPVGGRGRLRELALLFLKLGIIGFGGPAAHIAMMREDVVRRRGWIDDRRFVDLVGACNLIPGPNSTELAIHLGYERVRWRGLVTAGVCFIVPAVVIVLILAWTYVEYGETPGFDGVLYGVKPVVVSIIVMALLGLLRTAVKGPLLAGVAGGVLAAYLLGVNELLLLALSAVVVWGVRGGRSWWAANRSPALVLPAVVMAAQPVLGDPSGGQLVRLFLTFLKIGSVLYGSGYVLLAFVRADFVERLGWLTETQLLDAIAIGQVTPGPVFTTATFVGYVVAGYPGAVLATIGIFLPSFVFVALLTRIVDRIRDRAWSSALLDGVNAGALALMAGVTLQLAREALVDPLTVGLTVVAGLLLWRTRLNSAWYVASGGVVGVLVTLLG
ncbi:MAG: chromate efflux transporter [Propionibacteriales bacterium]|nr:chromate efflux transporter [Propionibacteriales bacterium]